MVFTRLGHDIRRPFKVASQILSSPPRWSLHDFPNEILVRIFYKLDTVDHIMLALCSKRPAQVSIDLGYPPILPHRFSLSYYEYKEHMEILVRLRSSVPDNLNICWYCGLYIQVPDEWDLKTPLRRSTLWDGGMIRAYFCPSCSNLSHTHRSRVTPFFRLSGRTNDKRERKNWFRSRQVDGLVRPWNSEGEDDSVYSQEERKWHGVGHESGWLPRYCL